MITVPGTGGSKRQANIECHRDEVRGITIYRIAGSIHFIEAARTLQRIVEHGCGEGGDNTLVLFSDVDAFVSCTKLKPLTKLVEIWRRDRESTRCGLVLPNQSAYAIAENYIRQIALEREAVKCFVSELAALDWLDA